MPLSWCLDMPSSSCCIHPVNRAQCKDHDTYLRRLQEKHPAIQSHRLGITNTPGHPGQNDTVLFVRSWEDGYEEGYLEGAPLPPPKKA